VSASCEFILDAMSGIQTANHTDKGLIDPFCTPH